MAITQSIAGGGAGGTVAVTSLPPLPAGSNAIGTVGVTSLPALPTGANTIGKIDQGAAGATAWKVDGSGVTQPVSGTVAVSSLPALAAGANAIGTVGVTSLPALPAGTNTLGKIDQGVGGVSAWKVDGSGVTQPVSGTVAVSSLPALPTGGNVIGAVTGSGNFSVLGTRTNNNAAPSSTHLGVLAAVANAAAPSWTEGNQVLLSSDLAGNLRTAVSSLPALPSGSNVIGAVTQSGTWNVGVTGTATVAGGKTNNSAAPGATNVGTLGAIANATAPSWTEGNLVALSTDLAGNTRVTAVGPGTVGSAPVGAPVYTGGTDGTNLRAHLLDTSGRTVIVGAAAAGAALAGNPVRVGISDGTNAQDWRQVVATNAGQTVVGVPQVAVGLYDNGTALRLWGNGNATDNAAPNTMAAMVPFLWNGSTTDKTRNNIDATLLASGARTTTQTSADITTYNCQAIFITVDVTTPGTGSITMTVNYKDPASGKYILLLSGAAVVTQTTVMYKVDPRIPAVANVAAQVALGRTIQIVITHNNGNTITYSVGYTLIVG